MVLSGYSSVDDLERSIRLWTYTYPMFCERIFVWGRIFYAKPDHESNKYECLFVFVSGYSSVDDLERSIRLWTYTYPMFCERIFVWGRIFYAKPDHEPNKYECLFVFVLVRGVLHLGDNGVHTTIIATFPAWTTRKKGKWTTEKGKQAQENQKQDQNITLVRNTRCEGGAARENEHTVRENSRQRRGREST